MLRKRKNKYYKEETHDDRDEGGRTYNLKEKIRSPRFEQLRDLQVLPGHAVSLKLIQKNGFEKPILVETPDGLDIRVPPKSFVVRDVGKLVGQDRMIDVMDVKTQKNIEMTMKDWCKYYESRQRDRLLNVISLEFSHTDLGDLIDSPKIIKHLDWVDLVWPKFLKESQTESTNTINKMKYPKVQKYCLMSVKGSYTDFHIDFGGTSVWYHILRGKKMFWMCPPTELNLQAFEEWTLSGMQQDVFFGDTVEECFRVELSAGNTFFIPSGWIHAVYTTEDSLVFGGNFLHSFGIENQLKVSRIEDATKVPLKFRYPFYTEILWYVVQHYVYCLTGKSHLHSTATKTPEKAVQKPRDKPQYVEHTGDTTESEQDESDTRKKAPPKKRGRPLKPAVAKKSKKPPTDDESTEIDSDLDQAKPSKSTATCRMTKNSLLRLQYEIAESPDLKSHSSTKTSNQPATNHGSKVKNSTKQSNSNADDIQPAQSELTVSTDCNRMNLSQMILSQDTARSNGWSSSQAQAHQMVWSNRESEPKEPPKIHITKYEVNGLRLLVKYLSKLSGVKKNMPALIRNSRALLDDCKKVIAEHENDDPELAATDAPVGPDLLSPKKSEINQLIEQFFKPPEANSSESTPTLASPNSAKTKSDSSTLTHQQRLKYLQASSSDSKTGDKKNSSSSTTDTTSHGNLSPVKDTKNSSPNKKFSVLLSPSLAACAAATTSLSTEQQRPRSPPTRPLSNKQYTSKTKKDNSLVLPGSFADLIAATSAAKEVFDVSSAEVTSSLFGPKPSSPSKSTTTGQTQIKEKNSVADHQPSKPSKSEHEQSPRIAAPVVAAKPNSPEPPKTQASKRFINPAYRPQNKEKLVFASAPYVNPAHNMEHSKNSHLYPWQSPAPHQVPTVPSNIQLQNPQASRSNPTVAPSRQDNAQHNNTTPSPDPMKQTSSVIQQVTMKQEVTVHRPITEKMDVSICPVNSVKSHHQKLNKERDSNLAKDQDREGAIARISQIIMTTKTQDPNEPSQASSQAETKQLNFSSPIEVTAPRQNSSFTIDRLMAPSVDNHETDTQKKPHKPRGPPKKSKEARQVLETDLKDTSVPVIVTTEQPKALPPNSAVIVAQSFKQSDDKGRIKTKRPKKSKGESISAKTTPATNSQAPSSIGSVQFRPQVICGLVAQTSTSNATNNGAQATTSRMNSQQYLISRPLLFNNMPTFCTTQLQQRAPQSTLPIFTTPVPSSMGLANMQPGARIVWATRPPATATVPNPPVTTNSTVSAQQSISNVKPNNQRPATTLPTKQPDNAALLSLATTALSTAPLPTTPTLSHVGARGSTVSQTLMVNPMMTGQPAFFAGQQFFNPFLSRMPMMGRPQLILSGSQNPAIVGAPSKPAAPRQTGQLLFAPMSGQPGQPRYLITQPGFLPHRPQASQLFATHQVPTTLAFAAYRPPAATTTKAEPVKVKKVKTR